MIPSVIFRFGAEVILVRYRHRYVCKHDALGRRIRGAARPVKFVGVTVSHFGKSDFQNYPPMRACEAARRFIQGQSQKAEAE